MVIQDCVPIQQNKKAQTFKLTGNCGASRRTMIEVQKLDFLSVGTDFGNWQNFVWRQTLECGKLCKALDSTSFSSNNNVPNIMESNIKSRIFLVASRGMIKIPALKNVRIVKVVGHDLWFNVKLGLCRGIWFSMRDQMGIYISHNVILYVRWFSSKPPSLHVDSQTLQHCTLSWLFYMLLYYQ